MLSKTPETNPNPTERLPDPDAMLQFVDVMFRRARRDGFVSFRVFADNGKSERPVHVQSVRLDDHEFTPLMLIPAKDAANWSFGPAVFAPPVATFKTYKNAKTDNLREGVGIAAECDQNPGAARIKLEALLGPATVVVESGGEWVNDETGEIENKVHLHWRLKKPAATLEELAMLYEARALAATLVGGDKTCISIVHPLRWPGTWHCKKTPKLARIAALSADTEIDLENALNILRKEVGITEPIRQPHALNGNSQQQVASDQSAIASALAAIPNGTDPRAHDWEYWNWTGMTIWASSDASEEGRLAWHEWSKKSPKYDYDETEKRWKHYFRSPPNRLGFGSLVWRARQADPNWRYENPAFAGLSEAVGKLINQLLIEKDEPDDNNGTGTASGGPAAATGAAVIEPVDLWAKFDPPPLPPSLLPRVIEDFATDRAATLGADVSGLAVTALAVCAGAISDEIRLQPKRNDTEWLEAARLWVLNIGDPSTMKTPIITAVTKPLRRIDHRLANEYQAAYARWKQRPPAQQGDPPPPKRRAMIFDTTIESTQEILRDSPAGVLLEDDELSGWFDAMYKYSGARGAQKDRSFWLQAYNGGPKTVDRVTRGMVHIPNLSVSIAGASQPGPIRKLANAGEDDGLLQRFNPIMLRPATGGRDEPPGQAVADFDTLINRLRSLRSHAVLKFDDGALKIREELERKHLDLMQIEWLNRKLTSHFGKYNGMFARLCLIWHCIEYVHHGPLLGALPAVITESTARRVADFLHGFLLRHAVAFYTSVLGLSNDHDRLSNIADYILAHGSTHVTNRDVQRGDQTMRGLERHETTAIFEQLEALGWVDIVPSPRHGYPPHWVVNPLVHQRFAERAKASKERREKGREMATAISANIRSKAAEEAA